MLADKLLLESLLEYIGKRLKHEVRALLIGGNAMLYYDLRGQTKDMDIVFYKKEDVAAVSQIIKSHPLYRTAKISRTIPYPMNRELAKRGSPVLIGGKDVPRFDLFCRNIFSIDASGIIPIRTIRFDLLVLGIPKPEDLIFLKAAADRPQDREDIARIVKNLSVDWNGLLEILKAYRKENSKAVFFAVGGLIDISKKEKIIPRNFLEEAAGIFGLKI